MGQMTGKHPVRTVRIVNEDWHNLRRIKGRQAKQKEVIGEHLELGEVWTLSVLSFTLSLELSNEQCCCFNFLKALLSAWIIFRRIQMPDFSVTWATSVDAFSEMPLLACAMLRWQYLNKHLAGYIHRISRSRPSWDFWLACVGSIKAVKIHVCTFLTFVHF